MSMRFRKRINLGSGVKLNINKNSVGLTGGIKGAHVTANSSGKVTKSAGIPGTGVSFQSSSGGSTNNSSSGCLVSGIKLFLVVCVAALVIMYAWIPAIVAGIIYFIYCRKTQNQPKKKYIILGALIFAVSLGTFIYTNANNGRMPFGFGGNQIQSSAVQK